MTNEPTSTTTADAREERGRQLARVAQIKRVGRRWAVPSQTRAAERYLVDVEASACTCPDFEERRGICKHQHAVFFWIAWGRDVGEDGSVTETITLKRKTYAQPCWRTYNASQVHEREYVERLLAALCAGVPQPPYTPGRGSRPLPIADLVFAVILKVFLAMSTRRAQSDLRESAARGNIRTIGHFNAISKFLAESSSTAILTSLVEQSAAPLCTIENGQYAIDSTGFSTVTYDRWFDQKHGKLSARHQWVKLHIACGTVTHAITAARVTSEGDCPQLPALLADTMKHHDVREVSADKAYSSVDNHSVMESLNVEAFVPFKVNAVVNPKAPVWSRHLVEFTLNQERFLAHYHRRSNVETVFSMLKARFGASVASRLPTARTNEVLAMCVAHNLCCLVKGHLHRGARADVLAGRAGGPPFPASQGATMSDLTAKEQKAVRTALRFLRLRVGAWGPLAEALRYQWDSIQKVATGKKAVTPALALRVARFAGVPMDELLAGQWLSPRVCPHCGHPPDDFVDEDTIAG